jgi:hypothetical protein
MSIFRVELSPRNSTTTLTGVEGGLDTNLVSYNGATASAQRTVYVMGPKKMNRLMKDGDTFTDCNYWKRFVAVADGGTADTNTAFLTIVSDDGGVWSDEDEESVTVVEKTLAASALKASVRNDIDTGAYDILTNYGGYAAWMTIVNLSANAQKIIVNPTLSASAQPSGGTELDLTASGTLSFATGDLLIGSIAAYTSANNVRIIFGVKAKANS